MTGFFPPGSLDDLAYENRSGMPHTALVKLRTRTASGGGNVVEAWEDDDLASRRVRCRLDSVGSLSNAIPRPDGPEDTEPRWTLVTESGADIPLSAQLRVTGRDAVGVEFSELLRITGTPITESYGIDESYPVERVK